MFKQLEADLKTLEEEKLVNNTITYKKSTHGGCTSPTFLPTLVACLDKPTTTIKAVDNFVDIGCGVGQVVLASGCSFKHMNVYGVELSEKRLEKLRERIPNYKQYGLQPEKVHLVLADITRDYGNDVMWSFLGEGRSIIYYNNFNLSGEVDQSFVSIVENYTTPGSYIICYSSEMFDGSNKVELVSETDIEVGEGEFSWMTQQHTVTVNVFRITS